MTINNNLIKFNNLDCFRFDNFKTEKFINLNICCQICKKYNINIFIIYNNYVYYRSHTFKDCIKNLVYKKDAIMYVYNVKLNYFIKDLDRVNFYTIGINNKNNYKKNNNVLNIDKFNKILNDIDKKQWRHQHYNNFKKFIKNYNFNFILNHYDLSYSKNLPTFVKSRNLLNPKKSVLLPLEDLYIPSFYGNILEQDITFNEKLNSCVWRGANSGNFDKNNNIKASRYDLVSKYSNNTKFNIGLSYANYKTKNKCKVKKKISIKEQLTYKFIISVEGNDFATNLSWIMLSNSVPLMAKCSVETWKLENNLIEYIHYIPLKNDFSDLETQMSWCLNNLKKCEEIAFNSRLYVLQFFDNDRENDIIDKVINKYISNVKFI